MPIFCFIAADGIYPTSNYSINNNNMHKLFLIALFLFMAGICRAEGLANFRQRAGADTLKLEEIVISGQSSPEIYSALSRIVNTISQADIHRMPANNLQDILEYSSALDIRQRGSHGVQADVSMRGGSFEQVLILLNGVRINDPQTGHHNLNIPVNIEEIERIEILHGPGSGIYGPNALSGAVNIITREPDGNILSGTIRGGEYGFLEINAAGGFESGPVSHRISAGNSSSAGFTGNTDFDITNIFYRSAVKTGLGSFDLQAGYLDKGFGASNFYTSLYPDQYERIKASFTNLTFQTGSRVNYSQSLYIRRHHDRFELFRNNPADWYNGHNYHMTGTYGTHAALIIPHPAGRLHFGGEIRNESILSSVLGEKLDTPKPVKNEGDALFYYHKARNQINLTAGNTLIYGRHAMSAGLLISKTDNSGWGLYGGIDISYGISNNLTWFSSWNQSLRIPSFTDMYYRGPVQAGNPDLQPEEAVTLETGIRVPGRHWRGHVALFTRKGTNIIDWVKMDDDMMWESQNISVFNTYGIDAEIAWFRPEGMNFPVNEIKAGYSFLDISKQSEEYISAYVLDHLRHKFVSGVTFPFGRGGLVLMAVYQDRSGTYTDFQSGREVPYTPHFLVDTGLNFRINKEIILNLDISNVFNIVYNDIGNVPVPGRWIKAGASFSLKPDR